jgi:small GTP-binding protein
MSTIEPISIAITGHANAGKTTLIRPITKRRFGQVADKAGVTETALVVPYEALQANVVDCPGFQNANVVYQQLRRLKPPQFEEALNALSMDDMYTHDCRAIVSVIKSDACLYVASVETAPDKSHHQELSLVKLIEPRTLGVVNKTIRH